MSLGFTEIILIVLFILIVFGAKRIPELARALGRASYEFKKAKTQLTEESKELVDAAEKAAEKEDSPKTAENAKPKEEQS
ncbi:MAG: twin-arginine translocase TatA/TatE family subunit [Victivallales bacterium]|nr:twin-arginine translocase TatA/TatE family subunit [Victivallales bacterium]